MIEDKYYSDWKSLVSDLESLETSKYIYRGHSNDYDISTHETNYWQIISSFNRYYKGDYQFNSWIIQQFSDREFNFHYKKYHYKEIEQLLKCSILERIYYLQHYGVKTSMIDFTKDALIALYFAITGIKMSSQISADQSGKSTRFPGAYLTVMAVDYKKLLDLFKVKTINNKDFQSDYEFYLQRLEDVFIGLDLNPIENCSAKIDNFNLNKQQGCFLLYDNYMFDDNTETFEKYIDYAIKLNRIEINEPIILKFHLEYNSVVKNRASIQKKETLFEYLEKKGKIGQFLFNDIQGLSNDLNYFHNK